jgi:hypothetical protein
MLRKGFFLALLLVAAVAVLATLACSKEHEEPAKPSSQASVLKPYTQPNPQAIASAVIPSYVTAASRDAYEFAMAHPEVLMYMPCYCGCGLTVDHEHNLDCFIQGIEDGKPIRFDRHGSACNTCVDIARDARDLLAQGKSLPDIRDYIDKTHGKKGPGTDTPRPPA